MYEPHSGDFRLESSQETANERRERKVGTKYAYRVGRQQKIKRVEGRKQDIN